MRKPAIFKQADISRAVKGAISGGIPIDMVEVSPDGSIRIFAKSNGERVALSEADAIEAALKDLENGKNKNPVLRRA
jgi:hypothetical protein